MQVSEMSRELIENWRKANGEVRQKKEALNSATIRAQEAMSKMGKFLCPKDAKVGERFAIWYGSFLITVTKTKTGYTAKERV